MITKDEQDHFFSYDREWDKAEPSTGSVQNISQSLQYLWLLVYDVLTKGLFRLSDMQMNHVSIVMIKVLNTPLYFH